MDVTRHPLAPDNGCIHICPDLVKMEKYPMAHVCSMFAIGAWHPSAYVPHHGQYMLLHVLYASPRGVPAGGLDMLPTGGA